MKTLKVALTAALLAMPAPAFAETKTKITDKPGHSESAPRPAGRRARRFQELCATGRLAAFGSPALGEALI
jgi:hypothetical protein